MLESDLIFIVGRQRSGTTVFRDLLERHGALNCDEIFHGNLDAPHRFYTYLLDRIEKEPNLIHPQYHGQIFDEYLSEKRILENRRRIAMDVKYFGLNLIPSREDVDSHQPFIVDYMRRKNAHVVHIVRLNKLRAYVSEELAKLTGRWSVGKIEHLLTDKPRLTLDVPHSIATIDRLMDQDNRVTQLLRAVPSAIRLHYHEMFTPSGEFSEQVEKIVAQVMGLEKIDIRPGNLRMNPEPLADLVENYDELASALVKTPKEWMLTDIH